MAINKAALARLAMEVRREVGLGAHQALDPLLLAEAYGVDVYPLSTLDEVPAARMRLMGPRVSRFSGALMPLDSGGMIIIENDAHTPERRRSTTSHEMAHVIREHPFTAALTDEKGCRSFIKDHEDEATELGAELLLPTEAARRCAVRRMPAEQVAEHFGVSVVFTKWRLNVSGGNTIARRSAQSRRKAAPS